MRLIFLSNYYTHHQKALCEALQRLTDGQFAFVAAEPFSEERKNLGWGQEASAPFVVQANPSVEEAVLAADAVLWGSAPREWVETRLKQGKIVFLYAERVFKGGYCYWKWLPRLYTYWRQYGRHKALYLLAASAFASADYAMHGALIGRCYKWGYFPETKRYNIENMMSAKETNRILWCGRLIALKHPEAALEAAERLKRAGYRFALDIIGNGPLEEELRTNIKAQGLGDCVRLLGSMPPERVRAHMETAGVYLFTSDFHEGWGAVLNEAMNSGCAVVTSHAVGSAPFLLKHGENGLVYRNGEGEDLYRKVKALLDHPEKQRQLGIRAYHTIVDLWNGEVAAQRLLQLIKEIERHGSCELFAEGPCSRAQVIRNDWFDEAQDQIPWITDEAENRCVTGV